MGARFNQSSRTGAIAFCVLAATGCSLFVGLDGLEDAGSAIDGSVSSDAANGADASTDAASDASNDAHIDAPPCVAASRVQFAFGVDDGGNTADNLTVVLPSASQAHDFIIVGINYFDCAAITSITDTAGNTYKSLVNVAGNDQAGDLETWGAANVAPAAHDSITAHFATACGSRNVKVIEYSGVDSFAPIADMATSFGVGGVPEAGLSTNSAAILFAHTADSDECKGPGAGFSEIFIDDWATLAEDRVVSAGGNFIASEQPSNNDHWGIEAVALHICQPP